MTKKEIAEALEEVRNQPETGEKVKQEPPQDVSEFWAKILTGKGYNVSSEEIASFIREAEEERRKKTAGKIEELSDQELEEVAGGKGHTNCKFSFENYENCWAEDGCDYAFIWYEGYLCKSSFKSCDLPHRYHPS